MASATQFDPYHKWLGIPPEDQPPNHYRLLGIKPLESDADVIQSAADQRMAHVRTYQSGTHAEFSQKLLNELAAARVCLLKPDRKQDYDAILKKKIAVVPPAPPPTAHNSGVIPQAARVVSPQVAIPVRPIPIAASAPPPMNVSDARGEIEFSIDELPNSRRSKLKRANGSWTYLLLAAVAVAAFSAGVVWLAVQGKGGPAVADKRPKSPASDDSTSVDLPPEVVSPEKPITDSTGPIKPEPAKPVPPVQPTKSVEPAPVRPRRMPASIDDGDESGFATAGTGWQSRKNDGVSYKGTHWAHKAGDGSATATWTFDGLETGKRYQVFATWHEHSAHASNAPFLISGIAGKGTSVINVDQREAVRGDARFNSHPFQRLGVFTCGSGTITIRLSNAADNDVIADAVLLVPATDEDVATNDSTKPPEPQRPKPALPEMPTDDGEPTIARADDPTWLAKFERPVTGVALAADASRAVVSTLDRDNPASYWDLNEHIEKRRIEINRVPYLCVAAVPGAPIFFLGTEQGMLSIWDLRDDTQVQTYTLSPNIGPITALAALADGKTLAIGGRDRVILVRYAIQTDQRWASYDTIAEWTGFESAVTALAISPDARRIVAGCGGAWAGNEPRASEDMKIHGFDVPTKDTKDFTGHHGSVWSMALSGDGTRLATGSSDGKVRLWDTSKGKLIEEMPGHDGAVLAVAITEDGQSIVSGGQDGSVRLWEARTGKVVRAFAGHRAPVRAVAFDARSKHLVSGAQDGELRLFDISADASLPLAEIVEKRDPPPSEEAQAEARKLVEEVFTEDFAKAKTPSEKLTLADTLLTQAVKSKDLAERFVLVDEARRLALAAGDIDRTLSAIRDQSERFEMDRWAAEAAAFDELSKSAASNSVRKQLAESALDQSDRAVTEDQYEAAKTMLASALAAAKKAGDALLVKRVTMRGKEVVELAKAFETVAAADETLKTAPDDAAANETLGRHLCFVRQNWSRGIPHLAKSENAGLAEVARLEVSAPDDADEQTKLADRWWELATDAEGSTRGAMLIRADYWYREALPQLSGLSQTKVNKRIEEVTALLEKQENAAGSSKSESATSLARSLGTRIRSAIKTNNLIRTPFYGRNFRAQLMNDLPPSGLLITGFNYSLVAGQQVIALQPMYAGAKGPLPGNWHGDPNRGAIGKAEAPKGYAVGGLEVYGEGQLSGFTVIYMKITRTGLDPKDTKRSNPIGWVGVEGTVTNTLGGDGLPVVGIITALRRNELEGFGLIQVGK